MIIEKQKLTTMRIFADLTIFNIIVYLDFYSLYIGSYDILVTIKDSFYAT